MYHILAGPEFNSPDRRPTSSLGILGAVQKQAVCVIKARLPEHALEARKAAAVGVALERAKNYVCGVEHTDPAIMDVMPNELVFRNQDRGREDVSMKTFVDDHPVYGKQYLTGDIQVEAFSALNGLSCTAEADFVFVGKSVCVCVRSQTWQALRRALRFKRTGSTDSQCKSAGPSQSTMHTRHTDSFAPVTGSCGKVQTSSAIDRV